MRLGILQPGDQLPTVKEVVGALAINPNTVLKAYRELDLEGLVEGRRGMGTFVSSELPARPPDEWKELRSGLRRWIERARASGLDEENMAALFADAVAAAGSGEGGMSDDLALEAHGLGKRYGSKLGACATARSRSPAGSVTALVGPERRRQDDAAAARGRPDASRAPARCECSATRRDGTPRRCCRSVGFVAQEHPLYRGFTVDGDAHARPQAQPELGRGHRAGADRRSSGCRCARRWASSRAASRPRSRSRSPSRSARSCSLLDEPVASLDPLARREFLQSVMEAVVETGMTVVLSSHIVADLERVCDHLSSSPRPRRSSSGRSTRSSRATAS